MEKFLEWLKIYFWNVVTKQYLNFEGRATREQFWYFALVSFVIGFILSIISGGILSFIISIALIIPSLAIGARRLHDINQTGWLQLVAIIPILGLIALVILWALPPVEPNKYNNVKVVETTSSETK